MLLSERRKRRLRRVRVRSCVAWRRDAAVPIQLPHPVQSTSSLVAPGAPPEPVAAVLSSPGVPTKALSDLATPLRSTPTCEPSVVVLVSFLGRACVAPMCTGGWLSFAVVAGKED